LRVPRRPKRLQPSTVGGIPNLISKKFKLPIKKAILCRTKSLEKGKICEPDSTKKIDWYYTNHRALQESEASQECRKVCMHAITCYNSICEFCAFVRVLIDHVDGMQHDSRWPTWRNQEQTYLSKNAYCASSPYPRLLSTMR
jgi:hypothetical protein